MSSTGTGRAPRITVLSGGLGGARLALAAVEAGLTGSTTFVTNVADDLSVGELPVSPDIDAVLYALAGRFDEGRGWGQRGDVFTGARAGEPAWFGVGAADRAHHERRRAHLRQGRRLSGAVAALARDLGTGASVLPVTDDRVRTRIRHGGRWVGFQEWLVRDGAPPVERVRWAGLDGAAPAPGVLAAIEEADLVVLGSSSPVASILPVLGVTGVTKALDGRTGPTLALSPVVHNRAAVHDRDRCRALARERLLAACGVAHRPVAVAGMLRRHVSHFAVDGVDAGCAAGIVGLGLRPVLAPVIGIDPSERAELVRALLDVAQEPARRTSATPGSERA